MRYQNILLVLIVFTFTANSYKILIPLPFTFKSVSNFFLTFGTVLAENGHQVVFLTPYGASQTHPNLTLYKLPDKMKVYENVNFFELRKVGTDAFFTSDKFINATKLFTSDERVHKLWKRRNEFDIILTDYFFQEMAFHFLIDFDGVFAQLCSSGIDPDCLRILGNIASPAVIPHFLYSSSFNHMSFWRRFFNLFTVTAVAEQYMATAIDQVTAIVRKSYPSLGSISEYRLKNELTFYNTHFATHGPVPLLPNQVQIGCLNCKSKGIIPKDLLEFIDGSGDAGVIYFSLGGMARPSDVPTKYLASIIEAFKQLPQRVIMKLHMEEQIAPNIIAKSWLPQQNLLAHPKMRLFVSHCGLQSVQEAQYHGVPILGLPIILDQNILAYNARDAGIAETLEWEDVTTETVLETINKILKDPSYKKRALTISKLLKDEMEEPAYRANWWIEYAVRHHNNTKIYYKGKEMSALHYKGKDLHPFQYLMIDVMSFIFGIALFSVFILIACFKAISQIIGKKKKEKKN